MKLRVLVTGGTGFIGRWSVESLAAKGYETHVCTRRRDADFGRAARLHEADLLQAGAAASLVRQINPTHLLHLAWETTHGHYWTSASNLGWIAATLELVRAAATAGCERIVAVGSCAEYDWSQGGVVDEHGSSLDARSLYGVSKAATFRVLQAYSALERTSFAWARVFYEYGPYEHPDRLVPNVIRAVLMGEEVPCTHGEQLRDFLYSVDAGEALASLLESGVTGPVNIGSGQPIRLRELIIRAAEIAGDASRVRFGAVPAREGEPSILLPAISRLHSEVGWKPRFTLDQGLSQTVDYWRREIGALTGALRR